MRKIESQLREAIQNFRPFSKQNTVFARDPVTEKGWVLYLHGNPIARFDQGGKYPTIPTYVSLAGWNSTTTRSRLNALDGVKIHNHDFIPYLNGREIESDGWWSPCNLNY